MHNTLEMCLSDGRAGPLIFSWEVGKPTLYLLCHTADEYMGIMFTHVCPHISVIILYACTFPKYNGYLVNL